MLSIVLLGLWVGIGTDPSKPTQPTGLHSTVQGEMNGLVPPKK